MIDLNDEGGSGNKDDENGDVENGKDHREQSS